MKNVAGKIHIVGLGLAVGIVSALYIFVMGLSARFFGVGMDVVHLTGSLYLGYAPSVLGSLIGALYAFVDGFVFGALIALFYNLCCNCCRCCDKSCGTTEEKK